MATVLLAGCAAATPPDVSEWFTWSRATDAAAFPARAHHGALSSDGGLWVIGGAGSAGALDDVWRSPDGVAWTRAGGPAELGARTDAATAVLGGVLWVIGGDTPAAAVDDVWWSLDGAEWHRTVASTGTRVQEAVVLDSELFVLGGAGDPSVRRSPNGGQWTLVTADAEPLRGRTGYAAGVHDGRIWIAGGVGTETSTSAWREDVWSSADGATWSRATSAAEFPHRRGASLVSAAGLLWLVGGDAREDAWISVDGSYWSHAGSAPWTPRAGAAVTASEGLLWLIGGVTGDDQALADVWWAPTTRGATP